MGIANQYASCIVSGQAWNIDWNEQITALSASTNNRASTVLDVFLSAVEQYGPPSQVQGDRGGENKAVCVYMLLEWGINRGSFIWGSYISHSLYIVWVFHIWYTADPLIIYILNDYGMRLGASSAGAGVHFSIGLRTCMAWNDLTLFTCGYFITCFLLR